VVEDVEVGFARLGPMQSPVALVDVEGVAVALAQPEGGLAFPGVDETVDSIQFDDGAVIRYPAEHAAPPDRRVLQRVTDQHDPPPVTVSEAG
jgi:hypothetical protein